MTNNFSTTNNVVPSVPQQVVYPQPQQVVQPQYVQQPQCGCTQTPQPNTIPIPSANGVNIVVYNPQVTPNANVSNVNNYPQTYPQNYYTMPQLAVTQPAKQEPAPVQTPIASAKLEKPKKEETPQKTKEVVLLTDDYIKMLESYLDNQDPKVRTLGVKELLNRYKEDDTRKADIGLTALLNKALQDPNDAIRFIAMSIINSGYATGDELTQKLLTNLQAGNSAYGDDALYASEVKLKTAGEKVQIPDTSPPKEKSEDKK